MPGCSGEPMRQGRCRAHAPPPWAGNAERRAELLPASAVWQSRKRAVRARARGRCEHCRTRLRVPGDRGTCDHRIPLALGGSNELENLWLLCNECAASKTRADLAAIREADEKILLRGGGSPLAREP